MSITYWTSWEFAFKSWNKIYFSLLVTLLCYVLIILIESNKILVKCNNYMLNLLQHSKHLIIIEAWDFIVNKPYKT